MLNDRPHRRKPSFFGELWLYFRYRAWTRRFADYLWQFKLTDAGQWLVAAWFLSGVGAVSVQVAIYQVFCALSALMGVAWITGHLVRPKLVLAGNFPEKLVAGQSAKAAISVTNSGSRDAAAVGLIARSLGPALIPIATDDRLRIVPAHQTVSIPFSIVPSRRGLYSAPDVVAFTAFPFDVARTAAARLAGSRVVVLPSFHRLSGFELPCGQRYQPGGVLLSSRVGDCPEYIGNREYSPGEAVRRLDFRAWARLGKPVVREYQDEYFSRVALILDTHFPVRRRERARSHEAFEAAVSLTASVADALSCGENVIDLFAAGPELYVFRSGRHTAAFDTLLELLACVDPCPTDPFDAIAPAVADELGSLSAAVCIFLDWSDSRRRFLQTIVESGCPAKAIIVRQGPTREPLEPVQGVEFVELTPDEISQDGIESL